MRARRRAGSRRAAVVAACGVWAGFFAGGMAAAPAQEAAGGIELAEGDTFVFLGDSITHQSFYTQ